MKKIITLLFIIVGFQMASFAQSWGNEIRNELFIYPNPASVNFTVKYNTSPEAYLEIYDMLGVVVTKMKLSGGSDQVIIDCSDWKSGYYFCKLINDNKVTKTLKLVVNN